MGATLLRSASLLTVLVSYSFFLGEAQTINTTCTLYPGAAYCTSTANDGGARAAAIERQQQYETGQEVGSAIGMAIFRAHFPGWRRKYCSTHPSQPFYYGNASGDSITGRCPTLNGLANEAAAQFIAKHYAAVKTPEHGAAIDRYIADNHLPPWEPKSYEKAFKMVPIPNKGLTSLMVSQPAPSSSVQAADVFVWFDEALPAPGSPLFEVIVSSHGYESALALLRQARQGNTAVRSGVSVLDTNYHPPTLSLSSWLRSNPGPAPTIFYWQGEELGENTEIMQLKMTKRAYEQMLVLVAGSET